MTCGRSAHQQRFSAELDPQTNSVRQREQDFTTVLGRDPVSVIGIPCGAALDRQCGTGQQNATAKCDVI